MTLQAILSPAHAVLRGRTSFLQRWFRHGSRGTNGSLASPTLLDVFSSSHSFATIATLETDAAKNNNASKKNNASPSEVNKFSSFASHWWDSRSNPLVGMNPIRIQFMREVVLAQQQLQQQSSSADIDSTRNNQLHLPPLHNRRVLDVGCGGGLLTESLSRLGASLVVGVDASPQVVDVAKTHSFHEHSRLTSVAENEGQLDGSRNGDVNGNNIMYVGGKTVEELAVHWHSELQKEKEANEDQITNPNQKDYNHHNHELFDIITALEIIEHVPNPTSLLQSAVSLLKPNGILFVSTINRTMKSYGLAIVAAEYISGKVPVGTHDWNKFWSPVEVERMVCGGSGVIGDSVIQMNQVALSGMVLQPPFFNLQWTLDSIDTDINWIGAYQKQVVQ